MRNLILAAVVVATVIGLAGDAQAGPVRSWVAERRADRASRFASCSSAQCQPAIAQPETGVHAAKSITLRPGDCPGGKCAAQPVERRGVFGLRK